MNQKPMALIGAAVGGLALAMFASGASAACSETAHGEQTSRDPREIEWMLKGKEAVKARLKDGPAARFKSVYFCKGRQEVPVTCGSVNGKNSFGGYGGFQRFISAGRPDLTYLETEVKGFGAQWASFCR
jgi:hypothetical protein